MSRSFVIGSVSLLLACSATDGPLGGSLDQDTSAVAVSLSGANGGAKRVLCHTGTYGIMQGDVSSGTEFGGIVDLTGITEITGSLVIASTPDALATAACLSRVDGNVLVQRESSYQEPTDLHGLERLTSVGGDLYIDDGYDSVPGSVLTGLSGLRTIGGNLDVRHTTLTGFEGLEGLRSVGGYFSIEDAAALQSLRALRQLEEVGNDLSINSSGAAPLQDLVGLEHVRNLGGLDLQNLPAFTSLRGLPRLTHVAHDIILAGLPGLATIRELDGVRTIGGSLAINALSLLTTLRGLDDLRSAGGVFLQSNPALTSLRALSHLTRVDQDFWLIDHPALSTFRGLEQLTSVGAQFLIATAPVTSLAGLSALRSAGTLSIEGMSELTSLDGLENLERADSLIVMGNPVLTRLDALSKLGSVGSVAVRQNDSLASLHGLEGVHTLSGDLALQFQPAMTSLSGLDGLQSVSGNVFVQNMSGLASVSGLSALTSVGATVEFRNLAVLANLDGFAALATVGGLTLAQLPELTNLRGLDALTEVLGPLSIIQNPKLSGCEADAFAQRLQTSCACPYWTSSHCSDHCMPHVPCVLCGSPNYCVCTGACDCSGNDNPGMCAP